MSHSNLAKNSSFSSPVLSLPVENKGFLHVGPAVHSVSSLESHFSDLPKAMRLLTPSSHLLEDLDGTLGEVLNLVGVAKRRVHLCQENQGAALHVNTILKECQTGLCELLGLVQLSLVDLQLAKQSNSTELAHWLVALLEELSCPLKRSRHLHLVMSLQVQLRGRQQCGGLAKDITRVPVVAQGLLDGLNSIIRSEEVDVDLRHQVPRRSLELLLNPFDTACLLCQGQGLQQQSHLKLCLCHDMQCVEALQVGLRSVKCTAASPKSTFRIVLKEHR
mmetsp:Transcript_57720/g.102424  ORF Transcript_57720/g.102424 Transcript_57720/m.102424 type:complete len:276 (-) Transcript_57720:137-964(-)